MCIRSISNASLIACRRGNRREKNIPTVLRSGRTRSAFLSFFFSFQPLKVTTGRRAACHSTASTLNGITSYKPVPGTAKGLESEMAGSHRRCPLPASSRPESRHDGRRSTLSPGSVKPNHVDSTKYPPTQIAGIWYSARKTERGESEKTVNRERDTERVGRRGWTGGWGEVEKERESEVLWSGLIAHLGQTSTTTTSLQRKAERWLAALFTPQPMPLHPPYTFNPFSPRPCTRNPMALEAGGDWTHLGDCGTRHPTTLPLSSRNYHPLSHPPFVPRVSRLEPFPYLYPNSPIFLSLFLSLSLSLSLPLLPFLPIPLVHGCKSSLPSCRGSALQSNWLKHSLNPKETNHYLLPSPISPLCLSFLPHAYPVSLSLWINLLFRLYSPFTRSIAGSPSVPGIPLFLTLTPAVSAAFYPRMCNSTVSLPSSVALLSRLAPPSSNPYRKPDVDASVASLCSGVLLLSIRIAACFSFEISRGNFLDELRLCRQMRGQEAAASRIVVADSQVYTYGYTRRRTVTWLCLARVVPSKDCL